MNKVLCFFVVALSICIYPIFLRVPIEITPVFGRIEIDIFSWYRMWLVTIVGILFILSSDMPKMLFAYLILLAVSAGSSAYFRTALFGSPWVHEGVLAIVGYAGLYLAMKNKGISKGIENSFSVAIIIVFIGCVLQLIYGNFLEFPPIRWLLPTAKYQAIQWPLYSVLGCGNHLGLFCSLFFPYTLLRKKYGLSALLLFMAIGCETRGAWLSIAITTAFIGRRTALYVAVLGVFLCVPFHKEILPRVSSLFNNIHFPLRDKDLSGRGYMWKQSLPQLKSTVLLGNGPAAYAMYFPQKQQRGDNIGFEGLVIDRPHNMYINIWTSTGFISLFIILNAIVFVISTGTDKALQMGAIGFLIAAFFTDSVLSVTPYFVIFLGALANTREIYEHTKKRRHDKRTTRHDCAYR